jgi:hypothetical protein
VQQFCKLFNWTFDGNKFNIEEQNPESLHQNLWNRCDEGISTCSNHAERINRVCNQNTKNVQRLISRISTVLKIIDDKSRTSIQSPNRQAKEMLAFLTKRSEQLDLPSLDECNFPRCNWGEIYTRRYNIAKFPCLHTVKTTNVNFTSLRCLTPFATQSKIKIWISFF